MDSPIFHEAGPEGLPGLEALLTRHWNLMRSQSPEESCHVLSADALRASGARVFGLYVGDAIHATGAFKVFAADRVEVKSMHVAEESRGRGHGARLLACLLDEARAMGATSAWLETGSAEAFAPARRLYERAGFVTCAPFGDYRPDPLSTFMMRAL